MDRIQLAAQTRTVTGKKVRALRSQGITSIHIYGKETPSLSLQADTKALQRVIAQAGRNSPVTVMMNGEQRFTFVREVQRHPVTGDLLHVDFHQVSMGERMRTQVPIRLLGEAPAVRMYNGVMIQNMHWLEVECLPMDVPEMVEADISTLDELDKAVHVGDLTVDPKVTVLSDPEELVIRVNPPRVGESRAPSESEEENAMPKQEEG